MENLKIRIPVTVENGNAVHCATIQFEFGSDALASAFANDTVLRGELADRAAEALRILLPSASASRRPTATSEAP